jgi:hypothetical protein
VINGTSMTTLSSWARLGSINGNGASFYHVDGVGYSLVVISLSRKGNVNAVFDRFVPFPDNPLLQDFYYILEVQAKVDDGVFIKNNPLLCLEVSTQWTRRNESYLEYNTSRVCE